MSDFYQNFEQFGWAKDSSGIISVRWDDNVEEERQILTSQRKPPVTKCYCKSGNCKMCKNCFKACKPCSTKCNCKGMCLNPHNNGGICGTECGCILNVPIINNDDGNEIEEDVDTVDSPTDLPEDINLYFNESDEYIYVQGETPYEDDCVFFMDYDVDSDNDESSMD